MIPGGYIGQKRVDQRASAAAKAIEHMFDDLPQDKQAALLAAVETVVSECLGFSAGPVRRYMGYQHQARTKQEILADPSAIAQIKKEHVQGGGNLEELPW